MMRLKTIAILLVMLAAKPLPGDETLDGARAPTDLDVPPARVVLTLHEALPANNRWYNQEEPAPAEALRWVGDAFLLPRIPRRYDDWGIRDSWNAPLLARLAADVPMRPGSHQILLRARALSRLWVDGRIVASTPAITEKPPDGEEPITPLAQPPLPGLRPHGYHQQEVLAEVKIPGPEGPSGPRVVRVVLELVVGGPDQRTETGEVCVAIRSADGDSYHVLAPDDRFGVPLTNAAVEASLTRIESDLERFDDQNRRQAAATQDAFWVRRHQFARQWTRNNPPPAVPRVGDPLTHPVDAFVMAKINRAREESSRHDSETTANFHQQILPLLQDNCFRCHSDKDKGGLRLNSRQAVLSAGESDVPAVVPGDPDASELISRIATDDESLRMPPTGDGLTEDQIVALEAWVRDGAPWPVAPLAADEVSPAPTIDDAKFLRRAFLDTIGVPPSASEARTFLQDTDPDRREKLIAMLVDDPRAADHWMSFWLDLLAENPTLINQSLNSTGPFRWFLYDALRDHKPLDRMVTELILMRGSQDEGGSAGFAQAGENDSPLAEKGHILASAFLGVELQCARCHDSPYHQTTQHDLFALAAMLNRDSIAVPETSRVPAAFFEEQQREPLIEVTLSPEQPVPPEWTLGEITGANDDSSIDELMRDPADSRQRLAALITTPQNKRFARVMVNRIWTQLIGAGIIQPLHDWEARAESHKDLLQWLAHELISHDYDIRHLTRLIMTSKLYQREAVGNNSVATADRRFFAAPDRRRLTAEQIVDSLFATTGTEMDVEELTFVHDGRRPIGKRQTLGRPDRAWMFASLNNERDRPSLSLPRARTVTDVLEAFGWDGSRQQPIQQRETAANVLQPGILAHGNLVSNLSRASDHSALAKLALDAESPGQLVDGLFLRLLTRWPSTREREHFSEALSDGFDQRLTPMDEIQRPSPLPDLRLVTWFNHQRPEATTIQLEWERRVRLGPPADPRLRPAWREVYEDVVWSLINHREFVWMP